MALSPLTLSIATGVVGRPFSAAVSGQTSGSTIELLGYDGAPGFSYANGRVTNPSLPWDVNGLTLRETLSGEVRDNKLAVVADRVALGAAALPGALSSIGINSFTYNFSSFNLPNFRKALGDLRSGARNVIRIVVMGPSTVTGQTGTDITGNKPKAIPAQIANALSGRVGRNAAGKTIIARSDSIFGNGGLSETTPNTSQNYNADIGAFGSGWSGTGATGIGKFGFAVTQGATGALPLSPSGGQFDTINEYWNKIGASSQRPRFGVNNAGVGSVLPVTVLFGDGSNPSFNGVTMTTTLGTHTVQGYVPSSGFGYVAGVEFFDSTTPTILVSNWGWIGGTAEQILADTGPTDGLNALIAYKPDLVIIEPGFINNWVNSGLAGLPSARERLQNAVTKTKAAGIDCVLLTPLASDVRAAPQATQDAYVSAMMEIAGTSIPLFDQYSRIGPHAIARPSGYKGDTLHGTATAYADVGAQFIGQALARF